MTHNVSKPVYLVVLGAVPRGAPPRRRLMQATMKRKASASPERPQSPARNVPSRPNCPSELYAESISAPLLAPVPVPGLTPQVPNTSVGVATRWGILVGRMLRHVDPRGAQPPPTSADRWFRIAC